MRRQGTVSNWNDERGFGFITPAHQGPRVFVHISALPRGRRPAVGDVVSYVEVRDERDRLRADEVHRTGPDPSRAARRRGLAGPLALTLGFLAALAVLAAVGRLPVVVLVAYVVISLVSFYMYGADKAAAQRGDWRVSEPALHLTDLLGGWPGGLVARHAYRHKTRKQPFRTVFWCTVVVNVAVLATLLVLGTDWLDILVS
ncbi:MAG TPA: cold shock and DUF1294 domain-containing protein [Ornithinibacter sp.]|nr:cold shock and DUF1294 domain-containing protein [Ornithinibacter sp.]